MFSSQLSWSRKISLWITSLLSVMFISQGKKTLFSTMHVSYLYIVPCRALFAPANLFLYMITLLLLRRQWLLRKHERPLRPIIVYADILHWLSEYLRNNEYFFNDLHPHLQLQIECENHARYIGISLFRYCKGQDEVEARIKTYSSDNRDKSYIIVQSLKKKIV